MDKMVGRQRGFQERKFLEKRKPDKTDKGLIRLVGYIAGVRNIVETQDYKNLIG